MSNAAKWDLLVLPDDDPDVGDLLALATSLAHLREFPVRRPDTLPSWVRAAAGEEPANEGRNAVVLTVGGQAAVDRAAATGLPAVAIVPSEVHLHSVPRGMTVCRPVRPRITSSGSSGRGAKTVGQFLPFRRNVQAGAGIVAIHADAASDAGVTALARASGVQVRWVDPLQDDVMGAVASAEVVCGRLLAPLVQLAVVWGRRFVSTAREIDGAWSGIDAGGPAQEWSGEEPTCRFLAAAQGRGWLLPTAGLVRQPHFEILLVGL